MTVTRKSLKYPPIGNPSELDEARDGRTNLLFLTYLHPVLSLSLSLVPASLDCACCCVTYLCILHISLISRIDWSMMIHPGVHLYDLNFIRKYFQYSRWDYNFATLLAFIGPFIFRKISVWNDEDGSAVVACFQRYIYICICMFFFAIFLLSRE